MAALENRSTRRFPMRCAAQAAMAIAGVLPLINTAAQTVGRPQETVPAAGARPSQPGNADTRGDDKFTFDGDTAVWMVAIQPGRSAAFEQVMARVRQALANSPDPQRQRQAAGWST
jgi:hypothetical protein